MAVHVEIHEPVNVLSTMLLTLTGGPRDAKLHPIAQHALEYTKPFADHPSLAWLAAFYKPDDILYLYGHVAQLSGPVTFVPRSLLVPAYLAEYEPKRMKELPRHVSAFYQDAKLLTFRRRHNAAYTLMAAEVKDVLATARIDDFLLRLYGQFPLKLVVVPVPTHPWARGGVGAEAGWEDYAFLFPPQVPPDSDDPVAWSLDPDRTQVLAQHELSHALHYEATRTRKDLVPRLGPVLAQVPEKSPFAQSYPDADLQFAELFIRGSSVSYLRRTQGDEAAQRWMEVQTRRLGTDLVHDFFLAIEQYLEGRRWKTLDAFLEDLPTVLGG